MIWKEISLAIFSTSWWPSWLLQQCLMRSSWRNPWRYEPYTSYFCPGFDYVIKSSDFLPAHYWDTGVNVIDMNVILILCAPFGGTILKWGAVVEPWAHMFLGLKGYCHTLILFVFDLTSQILYFVVTENEWHHHQHHCLGQKPSIIFDPVLSLILQSSQIYLQVHSLYSKMHHKCVYIFQNPLLTFCHLLTRRCQ